MAAIAEPRRVAEIMLSWLGLELVSCVELQSLWAGYGHICALQAKVADAAKLPQGLAAAASDSSNVALILKLISPPRQRGAKAMNEGHLRKMLSYEVEQYFYQQVAPSLPKDDVAVAECFASTRDERFLDSSPEARGLGGVTATIMTDLRSRFPVAGEKRAVLSSRQIHSALDWLAKFHGTTRVLLSPRVAERLEVGLEDYLLPPLEEAKRRQNGTLQTDGSKSAAGSKLWLNGGYTYLATRRKEYQSLVRDGYSEWSAAFCRPTSGSSVAEMAAKFLTPTGRPFESYIHGDVKSENLFTTAQGDRVAFYDFQYVGLGLGVCDLAKLFTCSVPLEMLTSSDEGGLPEALPMEQEERSLVEAYRQTLLTTIRGDNDDMRLPYDDNDMFLRHWETALVDWCRFQASWGFWGNTEWLEARVRSILADEGWRQWLKLQVDEKESDANYR
ncbi:hypothetical protein RB597_005200 [Gaeumannomyces tritici]